MVSTVYGWLQFMLASAILHNEGTAYCDERWGQSAFGGFSVTRAFSALIVCVLMLIAAGSCISAPSRSSANPPKTVSPVRVSLPRNGQPSNCIVLFRPGSDKVRLQDPIYRPGVDEMEVTNPIYRPGIDKYSVHNLASLSPFAHESEPRCTKHSNI
jgi:hypothetical protein